MKRERRTALGFRAMKSTKTLLTGFLGVLLASSCALWWHAIGETNTLVTRASASGLGSLLVEGHELHASLKTRQIDDSIDHLPPGLVLPVNPHFSTDAGFVEAISRGSSQGRLGGEGICSVLYARYDGDAEMGERPRHLGFYGLEAASAADADRREDALREIWAKNASLDRARVHREGLVLVVVWTNGLSPECWEAVNASVVERLVATRG